MACIQTNAGNDIPSNLKKIEKLVSKALRRSPEVIALPEAFLWRGSDREMSKVASRWLKPVLEYFRKTARESGTAFLLGGIPETAAVKDKSYNTAFWISPAGKISAKYQKIHLFDTELSKKIVFKESSYVAAGKSVITVPVHGYKAGLSICYDLRFPELFRQLTVLGARIIFVPANFTAHTGRQHWHVLLKARAVENQVFIVAPGQAGKHPVSGVLSYGHSLVIDPWGNVLSEASGNREEVIWADLDMTFQTRLRRSFPVLEHRKTGFKQTLRF